MRRRLLDHTYKKTVTGNPVIVKSVARMYPDISFPGKTEQQQTTGAQLWDVEKAKKTESWAPDAIYRAFDIDLKPNTTYTLFVSENNMYKDYKTEYNGKFAFFIGETYASVIQNMLFGNTGRDQSMALTKKTFTTTDKPFYFNLHVPTFDKENLSIVFDELLKNIMLVEGDAILPYEPYTGGKPSPSPEYKQDVINTQSPVQVEVMGANLFDISKFVDGSSSFNNGDGSITITKYAVNLVNKITDVLPDVKVGDVLYTSAINGTLVYIGGKVIDINQDKSFEITEEALQSNLFGFYGASNDEEITISDIIISKEYGTPYEPYKTPQTVTITSDRPVTKWDKLAKKGDVWGWLYQTAYIESYNGEEITGEWQSTTGELSTGASVQYKTSPEFIPLTEDEQQAMNALYTFLPTTIVQNSIGTDVTLTYKTKRSLEVMQ